jgi:hypothetical protein
VIERVFYTRGELYGLREVDGYVKDNIEKLLDGAAVVESSDSLDERGETTNKATSTDYDMAASGVVTCLEFHGSVQGKDLIRYGIDKDQNDKEIRRLEDYQCEILVSSGMVIRLLIKDDSSSYNPYMCCSWVSKPGTVWGRGIPQLLQPIQSVCDGSVRALVRNMAFASGPLGFLSDIDRVPSNQDVESLAPYQLLQFTNERNSTADPIKFLNVPSHSKELMEVYGTYSAMADQASGVPRYDSNTAQAAGRTSTGLGMILSAGAKRIKKVVRDVHFKAMAEVIRRLSEWDMQFIDNQSIIGDVQIIPVGAVSRVVKEQQLQRRVEFLNITNNPNDLRLIGAGNRAKILRAVAETLDLDVSEGITISDKEIEEIVARDEQERKSQADSAKALNEAKSKQADADAQAKTGKLDVEREKIQRDYEVKMRELDIREAKSTHDAGMNEVSASQKDVELQQKGEESVAKDLESLAKTAGGIVNDKGTGAGAGGTSSTSSSGGPGLPGSGGMG